MTATRFLLRMLLTVGGLVSAGAASALTTCTTTMTPLNFGDVDIASQTTAQATLTVTCNTAALSVLGNAKVRMCLSIGKGATVRSLPSTGSPSLAFQMYTDPAYTTIWGSRLGTAPANVPLVVDLDYPVPLIGGSATRTITLYGRTTVQPTAAVGNYTETYSGAATEMVFQYNESIILAASTPPFCTSGATPGATGTFPFVVSASVKKSCTFTAAASDLNFGSKPGPLTSVYDGTTTLDLNCRNGTAWTLGLSSGLHADSNGRRMKAGTADFVRYGLFRDTGRLQPWGTTAGSDTAGGSGTGAAQPQTVYGRVPAGQNVPAGQYSDTVTATITY